MLAAAIEEYSERGWAGLTMDGVAKRARVGKSTIYLRWTNKEDMLAAAVTSMAVGIVPLDTGAVKGDLAALADSVHSSYQETIGWGMVRILIDAAGSGEAIDELREVNEKHRSAAYAVLERGVERGELKPGVPGQLVINALYGTLVVYRMMQPWDRMAGIEPDPDTICQEVVDFIMDGLKPWIIEPEGD